VKNLVFGYINTNVIDGSAIFMSSLCNVLSKRKNTTTELLLAVPKKRNTLLADLEKAENIKIIDPFTHSDYKNFGLATRSQISIEEAAQLIIMTDEINNYDRIFIRSLDVTKALLNLKPDLIKRTFSYITGITSSKQELDQESFGYLSTIEEAGGRFLCQTKHMKQHILSKLPLQENSLIDLNPMIPDNPFKFEEIFSKKDKYNQFVYTGKFASEWNTVPMIVGFRELMEFSDAQLNIAGDQFKKDNNDEKFVGYSKYLLKNTPHIYWYGALNRKQSMSLIKNSDVGLSWRSNTLDDSLELSTKLLEYCRLAKPPIINKTSMHIEIFGEDYPFYADDLSTFIETMKFATENPYTVEKYAKIVFDISKNYTFTEISKKLALALGDDFEDYDFEIDKNIEFFEELPRIDGYNSLENINAESMNSEEYQKLLSYTKNLKEQNKEIKKQLQETKAFAELANDKYKVTMEKYKKVLADYNRLKSKYGKLIKIKQKITGALSKNK